jgi:hypothetical protein
MTDVARIYLGVGNPSSPVTGGRGDIFVEDIQLLTASQCAPVNPADPDITSVPYDWNYDCVTNTQDLRQITSMWLNSTDKPVAGPNAPIIKLDATNAGIVLNGGKVSVWPNQGSKGGNFVDACSTISGFRPGVMANIEGMKAVYFDGNDGMVSDFNTPLEMTRSNPWTLVATIWRSDENADNKDTEFFVWGKRSAPNSAADKWDPLCDDPTHKGNIVYSQGSFCYNSNGWGSFGGWAGGDRSWTSTGLSMPVNHKWHTLAITYQGGRGLYYAIADGKVLNAQSFASHQMHIQVDRFGNGLRMMLGAAYDQDSAKVRNLVPGTNYTFTGGLAKLEVYDYYMSPAKIDELFMGNIAIPVDLSQDADKIIDFKDIAVFANSWMTASLLGG